MDQPVRRLVADIVGPPVVPDITYVEAPLREECEAISSADIPAAFKRFATASTISVVFNWLK